MSRGTKERLGRGLGALLGEYLTEQPTPDPGEPVRSCRSSPSAIRITPSASPAFMVARAASMLVSTACTRTARVASSSRTMARLSALSS